MEFVIIICSATMQEEVEAFFKKNEIRGYTQLPLVHGSGQGGGTRLDTETWPGQNVMYFIAISPNDYQTLKSWVLEYRQKSPREGLKIFSLAMKEMI
jgi:hypothetical protein